MSSLSSRVPPPIPPKKGAPHNPSSKRMQQSRVSNYIIAYEA